MLDMPTVVPVVRLPIGKWVQLLCKWYFELTTMIRNIVIYPAFLFVTLCSKRIFILGPSHHVRLRGCALSVAKKYKTPLYDLKIDTEGA